MTDKDLQFKPATSGLGFHPFSDGLPYAPLSKRPTPQTPVRRQGTGAVAAGRPTFVTSGASQRPIQPQAPVIHDAPQALLQDLKVAPRRTPQAPTPAPIAPAPASSSVSPMILEDRPGVTYLLKRVFAFALDLLLCAALCVGFALALSLLLKIGPLHLSFEVRLLLAAAVFSLHWGLVTAQEVSFGTSFGKRILGLRLEGHPGQVLLRALFFPISLGFGGIGVLWAFLDSERRTWHDIIAGARPREVAKL